MVDIAVLLGQVRSCIGGHNLPEQRTKKSQERRDREMAPERPKYIARRGFSRVTCVVPYRDSEMHTIVLCWNGRQSRSLAPGAPRFYQARIKVTAPTLLSSILFYIGDQRRMYRARRWSSDGNRIHMRRRVCQPQGHAQYDRRIQ
jgi:hypothetical protein